MFSTFSCMPKDNFFAIATCLPIYPPVVDRQAHTSQKCASAGSINYATYGNHS